MAAAEKKKNDVKDDDEKDDENQQPTEKKGSTLKLIIIIAVIVVLLAGGGAAAYFFYFKAKAATAEKNPVAQEKPQMSVFWPMEPFIVNLVDNEGERYLKVVMQFELSDKMMAEEMKLMSPKLRDGILDLLTSKTYKEMIDPLGKQRLRDEIAMRINMTVKSGKVLKVYFTEFVIQ